MNNDAWPELPLEHWRATCATLHMWTQIVGKICLELTPPVNHFWNIAFQVSARGLTTPAMPCGGQRTLNMTFDFLHHELVAQCSDGGIRSIPLAPRSVAVFYRDTLGMLHEMGIDVKIWTMPVEIPDPIRFELDTTHASYDPDSAQRFWRLRRNLLGTGVRNRGGEAGGGEGQRRQDRRHRLQPYDERRKLFLAEIRAPGPGHEQY